MLWLFLQVLSVCCDLVYRLLVVDMSGLLHIYAQVASPDVVIPTVDTIRHAEVLHAWLAEHRPLLLCGPPGSGKTMSLNSTLKAFPDFEVVSLNFSSATSPELILKTFDHHCEYKRTPQVFIFSLLSHVKGSSLRAITGCYGVTANSDRQMACCVLRRN